MKCQELGQVLEENEGQSLPGPAQTHLESCGICRTLVEDLQRIVAAARELPAEVEPPERVWVSLRAQLESEKIIRREVAPLPPNSPSPWMMRFLRPAVTVAALAALFLAGVSIRLRPAQNISGETQLALNPSMLMQTKQQLSRIENRAVTSLPAPESATGVSLRENLKIVNNFIASCEQTVRTTPQNDLAREYLSGAYQEKAELLAAIQDRNANATGD